MDTTDELFTTGSDYEPSRSDSNCHRVYGTVADAPSPGALLRAGFFHPCPGFFSSSACHANLREIDTVRWKATFFTEISSMQMTLRHS